MSSKIFSKILNERATHTVIEIITLRIPGRSLSFYCVNIMPHNYLIDRPL